jgi:hypothetical protein
MTLYERLLGAAREQEYTLERPHIPTVVDGDRWLYQWQDAEGRTPWRNDGERTRQKTIRRWFWLRWSHNREWQERGGRL